MSDNFFTRTKYDSCASNKTDLENKHIFSIKTDSKSLPGQRCFTSFSSGYNGAHGVPDNIIDVSSDLRGQTRLLTRCPESRHNPMLACKGNGVEFDADSLTCKKNNENYVSCDDPMSPQYTRLNKPCNIFSGITIDRFDPMIRKVQIESSDLIAGKNTRIQAKDQFKEQHQQQQKSVDMLNVKPAGCKKIHKRNFCQ